MSTTDDYACQRKQMVDKQLSRRGIDDREVLEAMVTVPREVFVPDAYRTAAYSDRPLPIGQGQTISQPYMVAMMTQALKVRAGERVLDVGTGSGYAAAVLAQLAGKVHTVERHRALADKAEERFSRLGYDNIEVHHADGTHGWPPAAPFDAIVAAAAGPVVPRALKEQLAAGGRLVIPVGQRLGAQTLTRMTRADEDGEFREESLGEVRFVPLIGADGYDDEPGVTVPDKSSVENRTE